MESGNTILGYGEIIDGIRLSRSYFNVKELSVITNLSERALYRLIKEEEFPKIRVGRRLLFNRERVISYFDRRYGSKS
jgi:excisionase family DNA binding protein